MGENQESSATVSSSSSAVTGSTTTSTMNSTCVICPSKATKCCTGCRMAYYCGVEHQKLDWKIHKRICSPFILKQSPEYGRYFVAARKFTAGVLVFEEMPTFCAPRGMIDDFETPLCLSCCRVMNEYYRCSKCGWPVCSETCEMMDGFHKDNECSTFSESKTSYYPAGYTQYEIYKIVEIIRGVFVKDRCPESWTKMMDLQYQTDLESNILFKNIQNVRRSFNLENLGTEEDWNRILGIMSVNNFTMAGPRGSPCVSYEAFLYLKSSMFAHSCSPNCWWGVTVYPEYKITMYAAENISKGEIITVPYTYLYSSFGTNFRLELLKDNGKYICKCRRCISTNELGSNASALKCSSCKTGNVLPLNPVDTTSDWKCQVESCKYVLKCKDFNEKIETFIKKLEECDTVSELEEYISEHKNVTLHPNHWLITEAMDTICKAEPTLVQSAEEGVAEKDKLITYCEHMLLVKNVVTPGISLERARLINLLARLRFERLKILTSSDLERNVDTIREESYLILALYEQAVHFYLLDRTQTPLDKRYGLKVAVIISDMTSVKNSFIRNDSDSDDEENSPSYI